MSEQKKGFLREITEAAATMLQARLQDEEIEGVEVIARHKGNIADTINAALAGLGIYAFVWPCVPVRTNANLPGPYFDQIRLRIEVGEDPAVNSTGMTAEYLCEFILQAVLEWTPPAAVNPFWPPDDCIADAQDPDLNAYIITAHASTGFAPGNGNGE